MAPCDVTGCLAECDGRNHYCRLHRGAELAQRVGAVKHRCYVCKRAITHGDYVRREAVVLVAKRKGDATRAYQHLACAPPVPKFSPKKFKASAKPLLEGL